MRIIPQNNGELAMLKNRALKITSAAIIFLSGLTACSVGSMQTEKQTAENKSSSGGQVIAETKPTTEPIKSPAKTNNENSMTGQPKTVREFFMLLPNDYFALEMWDGNPKNYQAAKREYLNRFIKVEDNQNGYLEGDGDGAQGGLKMALFKRPNGEFLVGLHTFHEGGNLFYFLDYKNGKWSNVSSQVVPEFSKKLYL
jgi:hypothetical protein